MKKSQRQCRGCLTRLGRERVELFEAAAEGPTYAEMFSHCTGERPEKDDGLPDALCDSCSSRLTDAYAFVRMCQDSRLTLMEVKEEEEEEEQEPPKKRYVKNTIAACTCEVCGKLFNRRSELIVHRRVHTGEKPFACDLCPGRFAQSGTLNEHKRLHTGEKPHACAQCGRTFTSRSSFWRHRLVHTRERVHSCELCGKTFAHAASLKHHRLVHTDDRPHACGVCDKRVKSKYALAQHAARHARGDHVCERCGRSGFKTASALERHIARMHSSRAGHCPPCRRNVADLERHTSALHPADPHSCAACGRAFKHRAALACHARRHVDADKFRCEADGCDRAFPRRNMLDFHVRKTHSNEMPHVCRYCERRYFRISDLSRHVNTLHHDEPNTVDAGSSLTNGFLADVV